MANVSLRKGGHFRASSSYNCQLYFPEDEEEGSVVVGRVTYDEVVALKHFDFKKFLFSPHRDYLVRKDGTKVYSAHLNGKIIVVFGVCIPVLKQEDIAIFCRTMRNIHRDLVLDEKHDIEFVLVLRVRPAFSPRDSDTDPLAKAAFQHFFSAFSCLAIPLSDTVSRRNLCQLMGLSDYHCPRVFAADRTGKVEVTNASHFLNYGANLYPFSQERRLQLCLNPAHFDHHFSIATLLELECSDILHCRCGCAKQASVSDLKQKVVLVYLLSNGRSVEQISTILAKVRRDRDFEVVIVYRAPYPVFGTLLFQERARSQLQLNTTCGWLESPFCHKVSRRLWYSYGGESGADKLIAVGPGCSVVEPCFLQLLCCYFQFYGSDVYPFTRVHIKRFIVEKLRALTLSGLLTSAGIEHLVDKTDNTVPVSNLIDHDVLLYLGYSDRCDLDEWEHSLVDWYSELRKEKAKTEIVFLCIDREEDSPSFKKCISEMPWLTVPYKKDAVASVTKALCFTYQRAHPRATLVAFRSDHIHTLGAEISLPPNAGEAATFPEGDLLDAVSSIFDSDHGPLCEY